MVLGPVTLLVVAACGGDDSDVRAGRGRDEPDGRRYRGTITVLESPDHGPQMCSVLLESYPPQCEGPDVVGWSWDEAPSPESASGTTWGTYQLTGTWDGERLTLTEPPQAPPPPPPPAVEDPDFSTPCPEPSGGWLIVDPAKTTYESLEAVTAAARGRSDFAGLWVDEQTRPRAPEGVTVDYPGTLVLNVLVTGDVAAAERDLRAVWGGALCVTEGLRPYADLLAIQDEIVAAGEAIGSGIDERQGVLSVDVWVDDGLQSTYDDRYGPDTVVVTAVLQPVD